MVACPCGSSDDYRLCCGRYHTGSERLQAPTPEALMRSRYSAYVLGLHDYVLATWHASTRPAQLEPFDTGTKWLGLTVKRAWMASEREGFVEFVARCRPAGGGAAQRIEELSRFVRDGTSAGQWHYVDAVAR